ncbi:MAG TPA: hypothetical protein VFA75_14650 [Nevskia sp.]|nr:hypothetical protein [Nevskia sp.]
MSPTLLLRIAAALGLLLAAGHSRGAPWTPVRDGPAAILLGSMQSLQMNVMGARHSYWDFYQGFGLSISACLFAMALLLWQLAALARQDARRLRPLLLTLAAGYLAVGILGWCYIFVLPLVFGAAIALCILAAWWQAGRSPGAALSGASA